jgi:pimeloyl-ACP methyl ester carboxylesterase
MSKQEAQHPFDNPLLHATGWPLLDDFKAYAIDAWQRGILYADVLRQRANQYVEHMEKQTPNVLDFPYEHIASGKDLPRPVNYALVRILPPADHPTDPSKRPFVVVDPRAGHGPGIGGFKPESEVGAALQAGHACYFIGFLPNPEPGQTVEDVIRAEAAFLEQVIALHPDSEGKPAVIGNCQAGWQILMTAALRPELFGPIIVAGSPLSYWAGWKGKNPMRYTAGLLGGSWMTALAGDLGDGRFDGAYLVQNFENLNPANTLWSKKYQLYSKIDTETERYLDFEKYWGGYVYLNSEEMQYIVDQLFIGNLLATAELLTSDGIRIDLRNIRSPIVLFCSNGDNITPPPQALGWVTDLYQNDMDLLAHDQTIVYATHESIGHLGIFVSGSVGRKEHRKFVSNIEMIDMLPSGLYQAVISDKTQQTASAELASGDHVLSIQRRTLDQLRDIVQPDPQSDRRFATVANISQINLGLYRTLLQPWVKALATPQLAQVLRTLHPLRVSYEWWGDRHPLAQQVAEQAEKIRQERQPASPDNLWLHVQEQWAAAIDTALDHYRDNRDQCYERTFELIYSLPWVQALAGLQANPEQAPRPHPGVTPEHQRYIAKQATRLHARIQEGGLPEAAIRALIYIQKNRPEIDERRFNRAIQIYQNNLSAHIQHPDPNEFRRIVREQAKLLRLDFDAAVAALPQLLDNADTQGIRQLAHDLEQMLSIPLGNDSDPDEQERLTEILALLAKVVQQRTPEPTAGTPPTLAPEPTAIPGTSAADGGPTKPASQRPRAAASTRTRATSRRNVAAPSAPAPVPVPPAARGSGAVRKSRGSRA